MSLNLVDFRISKGTDGLQSLQNPPSWVSKKYQGSQSVFLRDKPTCLPNHAGGKADILLKTVEPNNDPCLTRKALLLSETSWGITAGRTKSLLKGLLWIIKINEHPRTQSSTPFSCSQHFRLESFQSGYKYKSPHSKKNVNNVPRQHLP